MGDEQLNRLAGPDAVQYLRFSDKLRMGIEMYLRIEMYRRWVNPNWITELSANFHFTFLSEV